MGFSDLINTDLKQNTESYTDLKVLTNLKLKAKDNQLDALPEVAKQFESIMIAQLIKNMRQGSLGDPIFDSSAMDSYKSMYDQQLSLELSKGSGIGLAASIVNQLIKNVQGDKQPEQSGEAPVKTLKIPDRINFNRDYSFLTRKETVNTDANKEAVNSDDISLTSNDPVNIDPGNISFKGSLIIEENKDSDKSVKTKSKKIAGLSADLTFSSPQDFVDKLLPYAKTSAEKINVQPEVLLAQAALETGWGQSIIKNAHKSSNNLFNIKADNRWTGDKLAKVSLEYEQGQAVDRKSYFRAYENIQQSFDDYVKFIQENKRYKNALEVSDDSAQYLHEIHKAGYATDPDYADKIIQVMKRINTNETTQT